MAIMAENDWYAVLQLAPEATIEQIAQAVEKRSRQATALANTAPERSQQLREQIRAIKRDLLSGDEARASYDAARRAQTEQPDADPARYSQPHQQHYPPGYQQWDAATTAQPRRANPVHEVPAERVDMLAMWRERATGRQVLHPVQRATRHRRNVYSGEHRGAEPERMSVLRHRRRLDPPVLP